MNGYLQDWILVEVSESYKVIQSEEQKKIIIFLQQNPICAVFSLLE